MANEPSTAESVLRSVLAAQGLDAELAKYRFIQSWPEIVGAKIAQHSKPISIRNGILTLEVSHSVWAQELAFLRQTLIKRVQSYLPDKLTVRDIQFCVSGARKGTT